MVQSTNPGAIVSRDGFDPHRAIEHKQKTGSVVGLSGTEPISADDLLGLECEVLIPAALENVITAEVARKVKTRILAEAAIGPTLPEADEILEQNGVLLLPDILANAGGVTVSYFEWVQNNFGNYWKAEEVNSRLKEKMVTAFGQVLGTSKKYKVQMRRAAWILAIERVAEAIRARGIYP